MRSITVDELLKVGITSLIDENERFTIVSDDDVDGGDNVECIKYCSSLFDGK